MSEYEMGKEVQLIQFELEKTKALLEQLYIVVEHNLKENVLKEPKKKE